MAQLYQRWHYIALIRRLSSFWPVYADSRGLDQPASNRNRFDAEKLIYPIKLEQLSASDWTRVALETSSLPEPQGQVILATSSAMNKRASVMIQKFVMTPLQTGDELLDHHTSRINRLVSLEIPKFATELAAGMDANFGIGTLAHERAFATGLP